MAVSIDNVYQKVLAFANKEQRGYITPQEFNLFADQAQLEILNQYFYDINQWNAKHGNSHEYSDMISLINEKIAIFNVSFLAPQLQSFLTALLTVSTTFFIPVAFVIFSIVSPNPLDFSFI